MTEQNNNEIKTNISPEQIRAAASAGVELLNTPGAVSVPSTMALTDNVKILHLLLSNLANGSIVVGNPSDLGKPEAKPKADVLEPEPKET